MKIEIREQKIEFVAGVDDIFFRIKFERKHRDAGWVMDITDILKDQVVYMSKLDASINPDVDFAEEIIRTWAQK